MTPEVAGAVNAAIPFFGGAYVTLLGFRVIGKRPGESAKYDVWHERYGRLFKLGGLALIAFGLYLAISGLVRRT
jgi:hypothetical protein